MKFAKQVLEFNSSRTQVGIELRTVPARASPQLLDPLIGTPGRTAVFKVEDVWAPEVFEDRSPNVEGLKIITTAAVTIRHVSSKVVDIRHRFFHTVPSSDTYQQPQSLLPINQAGGNINPKQNKYFSIGHLGSTFRLSMFVSELVLALVLILILTLALAIALVLVFGLEFLPVSLLSFPIILLSLLYTLCVVLNAKLLSLMAIHESPLWYLSGMICIMLLRLSCFFTGKVIKIVK
ncbi:hypothetical protein F4703DRAFT_1794226 [Phycomyces blakesleeanus]